MSSLPSTSRARTICGSSIRGGGHSYLGTSNAPDSLLIWTRRMNDITLHDAFVAQGCAGREAPQPAVTVGAGAIWMHTYNAVTTKGGRYVQGGGCGTVGVAGLVQGGGFGSYSKFYGTAGAALLEAEIVTADGEVRIANACTHADLFWALKGGGGGSFGVVTRLTLRTRESADVLWRRECDHPGIVRGGVSQVDRPLCRFLCRKPVQPALGRDRHPSVRQSAGNHHGFPGARTTTGGSHLATLLRMGDRVIGRLRVPGRTPDPRRRRHPSLGPRVSARARAGRDLVG